MPSLWRFGRHPLSSTSDSNDGRPAASASVDSSVEVPLTKTLPVLTPLPEERCDMCFAMHCCHTHATLALIDHLNVLRAQAAVLVTLKHL